MNDKIKVSVFESEEYSCKVETDFIDSLNIELQEQLLSSIIKIEKPRNFILTIKKDEKKLLKKNKKHQSDLKTELTSLFKKVFFRARVDYGFNYIKISLIHIILSLFIPKKKTEKKYTFKVIKWSNYDNLIEKLFSEKSKKIEKEINLYSKKNSSLVKLELLTVYIHLPI